MLALPVADQLHALNLEPGEGRYLYQVPDSPPLPVWYYQPVASGAHTPVIIVMHGVGRDADRYRDEWAGLAEEHGFVVLVPEFSQADFPRSRSYNLGMLFSEDGTANDPSKWSFSLIEPLFDDYLRRSGNETPGYRLYGHSAGAQFVHRFLYFQPQARLIRAVAANAGWYTLPDFEIQFPYGLGGSPATGDNLVQMLQQPLTVLLGTSDNDPRARNLRQAPEAQFQGPHRLARGQFFFQSGKNAAANLSVSFGWELRLVPGVGHDNGKMAQSAVSILLGGD